METRFAEIAVAGHVCIDFIPGPAPVGMPHIPGRARQPPSGLPRSTGGVVSNTGIALHRLGVPTRLLGKVGGDLLGHLLLDFLRSHDPHLAEHDRLARRAHLVHRGLQHTGRRPWLHALLGGQQHLPTGRCRFWAFGRHGHLPFRVSADHAPDVRTAARARSRCIAMRSAQDSRPASTWPAPTPSPRRAGSTGRLPPRRAPPRRPLYAELRGPPGVTRRRGSDVGKLADCDRLSAGSSSMGPPPSPSSWGRTASTCAHRTRRDGRQAASDRTTQAHGRTGRCSVSRSRCHRRGRRHRRGFPRRVWVRLQSRTPWSRPRQRARAASDANSGVPSWEQMWHRIQAGWTRRPVTLNMDGWVRDEGASVYRLRKFLG